jgi:transglutaminase-like putative cysteine protease
MTHDTDEPQPIAPDAAPDADSLRATVMVNSSHPRVQAFAAEHARGKDEREQAVALYYAVRDGFKYDPYRIDMTEHGMSASTVLEQGFGWCVTKAALLTAACRSRGIPSRMGFADVRNHLSTQRMREVMQTDEFIWHGYSEIWLNGVWRKATPAFNLGLCNKFGFLPLDFDGVNDSIYHPFDRVGQRHMEYLRYHGSFDDVPLKRMIADFDRVYKGMVHGQSDLTKSDFDTDVSKESGR